MSRYASQTEVSSDRSRAEIERTLARYGADQFFYGWQDTAATIGFRMHQRRIQFIVPLPDPNADEFRLTPSKKYERGMIELLWRLRRALDSRVTDLTPDWEWD